MADRDGSAVDVDFVLIKAQFADAGEALRAEGFVDFEASDNVELNASRFEDCVDRGNGADAHVFRRDADGCSRDDAG
jgi:hypothetical protein